MFLVVGCCVECLLGLLAVFGCVVYSDLLLVRWGWYWRLAGFDGSCGLAFGSLGEFCD